MQTGILRTVTLMILTVMGTLGTSGQTMYTTGNRIFNINVYRVDDDSPKIVTVVYKDDGPLYVVQLKEGKIQTFSVDGQNIPIESLGRYQSVIDVIKDKIRQAEEQARRDRQQAERDREQAGRDRVQAERDREQAERDREQAERNRSSLSLERQQAERDREQAERDRLQAGRDRAQAELDRQQAERDRIRAEEDRKMLDSLMRDLVADQIVPDRESVHSLKMDADEVIVNGKRLPEALEKKYLSKYAKKGSTMCYSND
ncbi:MAG TPA: hypothetical protein VMH27_22705 [Puia sp.]|nr:hypothetical protein [Puia sp.]